VALIDLRTLLQKADAIGELKTIDGADLNLEIGVISELSLHADGPALLFDNIPGYPAGYRVAVNVCSTHRRGLLAMDMDPDTTEEQLMEGFKKRWAHYKPVPPVVVDRAPVLENIQTGDDVNLMQFPVPLWHEGDGAPYIGTGVAIINQDPETGFTNIGTYRVQLHDRNTTGIFSEPDSDGRRIMEKYWKQGKPCPVAVSFGPEPLIFLAGCSASGVPKSTSEYDYTGFVANEPVKVIRGPVTGLPISAHSEIAIEGEIPSPESEVRTEGPFGEWTGYSESSSTPEPVIHVKALYYRNDPILYGAPPLYNRNGYVFTLPIRQVTGMLDRAAALEIPVRRVKAYGPLGVTVITVEQQNADDVPRLMDALEKMHAPSRLFMIVDDDVNIEDPWNVLWAVGTRFDPEDTRTSIVESKWLLDPLRTIEDRVSRRALPYKRMIINGCRPFDRLHDFPPVNRFSPEMRQQAWDKWQMNKWLSFPTI